VETHIASYEPYAVTVQTMSLTAQLPQDPSVSGRSSVAASNGFFEDRRGSHKPRTHNNREGNMSQKAENQKKPEEVKNDIRMIQKIMLRDIARENEDLRVRVFDAEHLSVAVMCVPAGRVIEERVGAVDQLYMVHRGEGRILVGDESTKLDKGDAVLVPAGKRHSLIADDDHDLKLVTVESANHDYHPMLVKDSKSLVDISGVNH
jgi:mannose-6-phosphate isomerase-like protein (cupin superfamily)